MSHLCMLRLRLIALGVLLVPLAACGPDARLSVSARLLPPLTLDMLTVTVRDGQRVWEWHGRDFRSTSENGTPHTPEVNTRTDGEAEVRFRLATAEQVLSEGAIVLPLRKDWGWGVDIQLATADPRLQCFGCVGSRAFVLAPAFRPANRDSIWLVWGGNSISNPVVY
jgi:hypothetical protein